MRLDEGWNQIQFNLSDFTRRAYGTNIPAVQSRFDTDAYALQQEVIAWELPEEVIENAGEGPAQVDLRAIETRNAMSRLMNAYEYTVSQAVTVTGTYNPYEPYNGTPGSQTGQGFTTWSTFKTAYSSAGGDAAWPGFPSLRSGAFARRKRGPRHHLRPGAHQHAGTDQHGGRGHEEADDQQRLTHRDEEYDDQRPFRIGGKIVEIGLDIVHHGEADPSARRGRWQV